ncbi:FYN-binding protein 1 [Myxocyprinus asiaticus]|uniref:FYN-binding protein 1 n=1 Tax=Myxocyprinus asiaticus TaxID=70543 RepID=UPI0022213E2F|nr:FYN-binding protein 1 [Myxocyprinus asiaticus]
MQRDTPLPKPLMVKPNFTVNSMETRYKPPFSDKPQWRTNSRVVASGVTLPSHIAQSGTALQPVGYKGLQDNSTDTQARTGFTGPLNVRSEGKRDFSSIDMGSDRTRPLSPPKLPVMQKPSLPKDITASPLSEQHNCALFVPKMNPLPSVFALGMSPAKPQRPPYVNLAMFRGNVSNTCNSEQFFPLSPPPEHPSITYVTPPPPADFTFPPAPLPMDPVLMEDHYDDVEFTDTTQSSLGISSIDPEESDEETYMDLDESWPENKKEPMEETKQQESKEEKKKLEKEEKKRLELEKKLKKEREKREQEARKKFKIKGPIAVVETVKAQVEVKGGKNKLPLKHGETIEIVCKIGYPKDNWLARNSEGHYGFVKPDTVAVESGDMIYTQDVYDDAGVDDEDINLPEDSPTDFSFPPPPPADQLESNGGGATEETYDDISTNFPPPPSPNCIRRFSSTSKTEEMDPKAKKKFEKEEKEFRKKFKYNGEIRVLYQGTVLPSLSIKKFGNKDLPVKPGEIIDVIVCPVGGKFIGRNSEGKCDMQVSRVQRITSTSEVQHERIVQTCPSLNLYFRRQSSVDGYPVCKVCRKKGTVQTGNASNLKHLLWSTIPRNLWR